MRSFKRTDLSRALATIGQSCRTVGHAVPPRQNNVFWSGGKDQTAALRWTDGLRNRCTGLELLSVEAFSNKKRELFCAVQTSLRSALKLFGRRGLIHTETRLFGRRFKDWRGRPSGSKCLITSGISNISERCCSSPRPGASINRTLQNSEMLVVHLWKSYAGLPRVSRNGRQQSRP